MSIKVVYFGAGKFLDEFAREINFLEKECDIKCIGVMDNNSLLFGKKRLGNTIIPPQRLEEGDYYLITSKFFTEIRQQLEKQLGIKKDIIFPFDEFYRQYYTKFKYSKRYTKNNYENKLFYTNKITVYTCITGDYDQLKDPLFLDPNIEYVCFTNNKFLKSDVWNIITLKDEQQLENVYLARKVKLFPEKYLPNSPITVWVDAKYLIKSDLRKYIREYGKSEGMLCFPHPNRDCIYEESNACIRAAKIPEEVISKQIDVYKKLHYPVNNGLYETGCIVRARDDFKVRKIMQDWWVQIQKYSYRDQVSLPYVCWKNKYLPDICDLDINNNRWLSVYKHKE